MEIKTILEKTETFLRRLGDLRFAGQVLFVILVLLISWSGIKTIQANYNLQKQISALNQQNEVQKLRNNNLGLQNDYLKTNQYLELSARQNFGLANPGEKEIVVPERVALAYTVDVSLQAKNNAPELRQPFYQRNFQSWVDFFMHRQAGN